MSVEPAELNEFFLKPLLFCWMKLLKYFKIGFSSNQLAVYTFQTSCSWISSNKKNLNLFKDFFTHFCCNWISTWPPVLVKVNKCCSYS